MEQTIIILSNSSSSDDSLETFSVESYGSGRRKIPTKPVMSYNKSSTFMAKHKSYNEETPLKQHHQNAFTSKQETLEIIKRLNIKCGFLDNDHVFMLTKNSLEYLQYEDIHVEITKKLYNAYCWQKIYVEKYFKSWDPKIHGPRNYLQSFYVAAFIEEFGNKNHYPLAMFLNGISKNTRSSYKGTMNDGTPSLSSRSKMASKKNKNRCSTFKIKIKMHCYYLKIDDDALFNNG